MSWEVTQILMRCHQKQVFKGCRGINKNERIFWAKRCM